MKIEFKCTLSNHEAIINRIEAYLKYPKDAQQREALDAKFVLDNLLKNKSMLEKSASNNIRNFIELVDLAQKYVPPHKGKYVFRELALVGHFLSAMIRMEISGIEPSLKKAYKFYEEIDCKHPDNMGLPKAKRRQLEQAWEKYQSVAHIALVFGASRDIEIQYPALISSLYSVQHLYLKIINKSKFLDVTIWELPNLDNLVWSRNQVKPPLIFIRGFLNFLDFKKLNEDEIKILTLKTMY